uniref:tRNA N(3)-methylcytidine methyltransferase n=2 Tax=Ciona intestinalis TaxID=7719 RepID=F6XYB7_CIOIN|nr:methyltransferase-like protein 6 isoform X1 [Ciona intestinalis]|eukprot:XP_002129350.1 methyltransferase-like protein 6 isoform X1 [Ciona intestinalis]
MEDFESKSQYTSSQVRSLSDDELQMLENQNKRLVTEFRSQKLEVEAKKMWDLFYKRNTTNFFKDRHWTSREFGEIEQRIHNNQQTVLLEAGCGVGNAIFPLMAQAKDLFVYACDFSPRAVELVKDNPSYSETKCKAFQCDLGTDHLSYTIQENSVDLVTLIFVLSAIHPDKFEFVLRNIHKVLKPGGYLLFRDYGLNDWAMLRFNNGSKISENFYVRQDGTRAYYFKKEELESLTCASGFDVVSNEYVMRETINKKKNLKVPRVFLQGKYQKPAPT